MHVLYAGSLKQEASCLKPSLTLGLENSYNVHIRALKTE